MRTPRLAEFDLTVCLWVSVDGPSPGSAPHRTVPCNFANIRESRARARPRARRAVIALSLIKPFKRLLFGFVVAYRTITLPDRPQQRRGSQRRRPADLHPANCNAPGGTRENRHTKQQRALAPRVLTEHTKRLQHQQTHNPMSRVRELSDRLA